MREKPATTDPKAFGRLYVDIKTFNRFRAACKVDGRKIYWQAKQIIDRWLDERKNGKETA